MSNLQGKQAEFMVAGEQRLYMINDMLKLTSTPEQLMLYMNLCEEEFKELEDSFEVFMKAVREDEKIAALADLLDAVCDLTYVLMGLCNSAGLPFHEAFDEVHRANMAKFERQDDGTYKILRRVDGKIVKPKDWKAPNIINILKYRLIQQIA